MKKIFSIVLIAILAIGSAQAQLDTILHVDFANGIPAGWGNTGTAAGAANSYAVWRYTHTGSHGAYGSPTDFINSPTKANGFIIFDSDSLDNGGVANNFGNGPAPAPQVVDLTSTAINVTGTPYCKLSFYQYYRNFQSTTVVGVSTDSVTWYLDTINSSVAVNANTAANSQINVDLTPVILASGTPANKVYIRFEMDADYYFWMIDDILITTLPNNDLAVNFSEGQSGSSGLGLFYSKIPASQADSFIAVTSYGNIGQDVQPNTRATFTFLKNGTQLATYTTTPAVASLAYGIDTTDFTSFYTQGIGNYIVAVHVQSDSTDFYPGNNTDSITFAVTDSVYSINTSTVQNASAYFLLRNNYGSSYSLGTLFEVDQADTVTSITTAIAGGTQGTHAGAVIQGAIYPVTIDLTSSTPLQYNTPTVSTFQKTLTAGNISSSTAGAVVTPVTMAIDNSSGNAILQPGVYWCAISGISTPDSNILICSTNYQTDGFPVVEQNSQLYYLSATDAAYCNMNFGHDATLLYASWTRNPASASVKEDHPVVFTAHTNASGSATYQWDFTGNNTGALPGATGRTTTQTFTAVDSYYVCLTVTDGGYSTAPVCSYVPVVANTGINEVSALTNVSLVPNPTTGRITISASDVTGDMSIAVINLLGETVKTYAEQANGSFSKSYNLSDLASGVYLVKIQNGANTVTQRVSLSK